MSAEPDCLVTVVTGKLGSGKTFAAVIAACEALMQGRVVVSNVELHWAAVEGYCRSHGAKVPRENYRYVPSETLEAGADALKDYLCEGAFLLLDEIHLFMDARKYRENAATGAWFQQLLTQARKHKLDVWLVSQSAANIDAQLVRQATYIVRVSNWLHFPILGTLFPLPYTIARKCAPDGRTVYSRDWIFRSAKIGRLYDTRQKFKDLGLAGNQARLVIGRKRRKTGYGVVLVTVGSLLLALDWWLDRDRYDLAAEYAKKNPQPQPVEVPVVQPQALSASMPGAYLPESAHAVYDRLLAIESTLPAWTHVSRQFIHFEGNDKIEIGSPFGCGHVKSWRLMHGGRIVVLTDSELTPEINIYQYGTKPYRYTSGGAPAGHSLGTTLQPLAPLTASPDGMARREFLNRGGALGEVGPRGELPPYQSPAPVIIPTLGLPSRLPANQWIE